MVLPGIVSRQNPYTYGVDFTNTDAAAASTSASGGVLASTATAASEINGIVVQNLTSSLAANGTASSLDQARRLDSFQTQQAAANLAQIKLAGPQVGIMQLQDSSTTGTRDVEGSRGSA